MDNNNNNNLPRRQIFQEIPLFLQVRFKIKINLFS